MADRVAPQKIDNDTTLRTETTMPPLDRRALLTTSLGRANLMAQVNHIKVKENPMLLPGIKIDTSPTHHHPLRQMQLQRRNGQQRERFGSIIEGAGA